MEACDIDISPEKKFKKSEPVKLYSEMENCEEFKISKAILYFAPERIQKNRLSIMKNCAIKNGFNVVDTFRDLVTYIVTEFEEEIQVVRSLKININEWYLRERPKIVNTKWFAECIKQKKLVTIQSHHCLKVLKVKHENIGTIQKKRIQHYACQRINPLKHHNHRLTNALEILAEEAELKNDVINMGRALAFRKAASVLKSLSKEISKIEEVKNMKDLGKHSLNVIKEILEKGKCIEVEEISKSEWFLVVKLFNSIYGIGPASAKQWYILGLRTIEDALKIQSARKRDKRIHYGLAFHGDLSKPISKTKALEILNVIESEAKSIEDDVMIYLIGGFRRGKIEGHDVDILISHPIEGKEIGLLSKLFERLKNKNLILYGGIKKSDLKDPLQLLTSNTSMDNFEKCFLIFKDFNDKFHQDKIIEKTDDDLQSLLKMASQPRNWTARRVDLVVSSFSQFYFALVGWTGNKHFNRSLRDYAKHEKNMKLTSHGLYDFKKNQFLPASSEKEVFDYLDLPYFEPYYRNA